MQLLLYSLVALIPIATVFVLLVIARRPAGQAMPVAYLVTAGIAGMTATDAPYRQPRSLKETMFLQGLDGIAGTGRIEPASPG